MVNFDPKGNPKTTFVWGSDKTTNNQVEILAYVKG